MRWFDFFLLNTGGLFIERVLYRDRSSAEENKLSSRVDDENDVHIVR